MVEDLKPDNDVSEEQIMDVADEYAANTKLRLSHENVFDSLRESIFAD